MADVQHTVGAVIRRERQDRGLTLKDLARRAALSVVYLGEIERGRKCPSIPVLEHLARALEMAVPDLLELVAHELRGAPQPAITQAVGFQLPATEDTAAVVDDAVVSMQAPAGLTAGDLTAYFRAVAA